LAGLFFKDNKVLNYFAPQSKVKQHATHIKKAKWLSEENECRCPDAFVEFAKNTRHLKFFAKEVLKEWN